MVAYQADDQSLTYTYSRTTLTPDPWSPAVAAIKVEARPADCCSAEEVPQSVHGLSLAETAAAAAAAVGATLDRHAELVLQGTQAGESLTHACPSAG